jgi:PhzF family phenazine biosynthesis protein
MVETRSGTLQVDVDWQERFPLIKFSLPIPSFTEFSGDLDFLMHSLNLTREQMDKEFNPLIDHNGYLYFMVQNQETLSSIQPNRESLLQLKQKHDVLAIAAGTLDTTSDGADWDLRFFAPALGVPEDPVTGSANGPMACYLLEHQKVKFGEGELTLKGRQGHFMDREGIVYTLLRGREQQVNELKIAGSAVTVVDGHLRRAEVRGDGNVRPKVVVDAGEAFVDPGQGNVHIASNPSTTADAVAYATFLGVPDGEPATVWVAPVDCQ